MREVDKPHGEFKVTPWIEQEKPRLPGLGWILWTFSAGHCPSSFGHAMTMY